jgi:hypothetical protein
MIRDPDIKEQTDIYSTGGKDNHQVVGACVQKEKRLIKPVVSREVYNIGIRKEAVC